VIGLSPNSLSGIIKGTGERRKKNEKRDAGICHALDIVE